jgi:hypothetical protein
VARCVSFLKGVGPIGLIDVPKTMELGTARHKQGSHEKAHKNLFINCIQKLVF